MAHEPSEWAGIVISHLPKSNFVNGFASHCQLSREKKEENHFIKEDTKKNC